MKVFLDLLFCGLLTSFVDDKDFHAIVEETAGIAHVDGSFLFITSQNPQQVGIALLGKGFVKAGGAFETESLKNSKRQVPYFNICALEESDCLRHPVL